MYSQPTVEKIFSQDDRNVLSNVVLFNKKIKKIFGILLKSTI